MVRRAGALLIFVLLVWPSAWLSSGPFLPRNAVTQTTPAQSISPGQTCTLTVWCRGSGPVHDCPVAAHAELTFLDPNLHALQTVEKVHKPNTVSEDWRAIQITATAPEGATRARVTLSADGAAGSVWFDDVVLSVAGGPNPLSGGDMEREQLVPFTDEKVGVAAGWTASFPCPARGICEIDCSTLVPGQSDKAGAQVGLPKGH